MLDLVRNLGGRVMGVLSGFDRLLFRGILRCVINPRGLNGYLYGAKVRMTDFDKHAQHVTAQVIEQSLQHARQTGREIHYVKNSHIRKQQLALDIAARPSRVRNLGCRDCAIRTCGSPCTGPIPPIPGRNVVVPPASAGSCPSCAHMAFWKRYRKAIVTAKGQQALTALLAAANATPTPSLNLRPDIARRKTRN